MSELSDRDFEKTEQAYRGTPFASRKYLKRLTEYITALIDRGRVIEGVYYFSKLSELNPAHGSVIRIGYALAIATFDFQAVAKYDKLLIDSRAKPEEVLWFQLRFYYSKGNVSACEVVSQNLLSAEFNAKYLSTVIEVCLVMESFVMAEQLSQYLDKYKIRLHAGADKKLKSIVVQRFVDVLGGGR